MAIHQKEMQIIEKYSANPSALIQILSEIQELNGMGYLSIDALKLISNKLNIPLSKIYGVLTFYSFFRLVPPAKNQIHVCVGTACHVKGAMGNADQLKDSIGINFGEQTPDNQYSIEKVACLGACSLAPTIVVNGKIKARQNIRTVNKLLDNLRVPRRT
ncbi:MAG: NADH-quinone oxidoreductase subunit NuoE family protein [Candidatus Hodarchaeales archaeon]|jgi:NADH-quinone oxidoreductase subunit E/NADP-reducing hydrogenase subunit HndA